MINFSEKVCEKDFILENLSFFSVIFPSDNPITAGVSQITWGRSGVDDCTMGIFFLNIVLKIFITLYPIYD